MPHEYRQYFFRDTLRQKTEQYSQRPFADTLESKIDYLVNKLKIKRFTLYIHPYIAAYVNQGLVSLKRKWQMKYGFGIKIIPDQSLAFLQYKFTDMHGEEIDMKEEIEIK